MRQALEQQETENMIRDMDLIREILLKVEEDPNCNAQNLSTLDIPGRSAEELHYHTRLLIRAGFVEGNTDTISVFPIVSGLTWSGHELLDNIKDPGIWEKTKQQASSLKGVGLSIMAQIAEALVKKHFNLP